MQPLREYSGHGPMAHGGGRGRGWTPRLGLGSLGHGAEREGLSVIATVLLTACATGSSLVVADPVSVRLLLSDGREFSSTGDLLLVALTESSVAETCLPGPPTGQG